MVFFGGRFEWRMWSAGPEFRRIFREAATLEQARGAVLDALEAKKRAIRAADNQLPSLEWVVVDDCLDVLRNCFSERSEKAAKFSALSALWRVARDEYRAGSRELKPGFFEEFRHLFLGVAGKSGIYEGERLPEYAKLHGRDAAVARSADLDRLAARVDEGLSRYPSGLDEPLWKERRRNARRIRKFFGASDEEWNDWQWQWRHVVRDRRTLANIIPLSADEKKAVELAARKGIPFGVTPYYASLIRPRLSRSRVHATRAQVIPPLAYVENMVRFKGRRDFECDFMLERDTSPVDLITRRYPLIAILKPYNSCFQVCVYCQRNWEIVGPGDVGPAFSASKLDAALAWIKKHPAVREVLITGGEPLALADDRLAYILDKLAAMDHVTRIRIGTRAPVVVPMRITETLSDLLSSHFRPPFKEVVVVTHFQHAAEVTPEAFLAVLRLRLRGIPVYNQTVFTSANCRRFEISALRLQLRRIGVDPYYLFNAKAKKEIAGYSVPIARLQQEWKEEARLLPGIVRTDVPVYNIPRLGKNYVMAWQHHRLIMVLPDGRRLYEFHPWEKQIAMADVYVEADVPIYDFLEDLRKRGESVEAYKSIWYYF